MLEPALGLEVAVVVSVVLVEAMMVPLLDPALGLSLHAEFGDRMAKPRSHRGGQ